VLANHPRLVRVLEAVENGVFSPREPGLFGPLVRNLAEHDPYLVLADYDSSAECQGRVAARFTALSAGEAYAERPGRQPARCPST
jgi:starch phosphorylase